MRIEFSRYAESDLAEIADFIASNNPARAVSFIREIREEIRSIARQPMLFHLRPEIGRDARIAIAGRYIVLFRIRARAIRIERVVYGGRDLPSLLR